MKVVKPVKRNVLLNPGPATTSDAVKYAQVVPDICPREQEFVDIMADVRNDLVKIVHGDPLKYTAVIFTGSGTIIQDVLVNSLVPEGKKLCVVNNGAYAARMVEIAEYYHTPCVDIKFPSTGLPDLATVRDTLVKDADIAVVMAVHHETGTGVLNPIREIGAIAHDHGCVFVVDTISTYGLRPIDIEAENIDFLMSSAQKGLAAMTGASWTWAILSILKSPRIIPPGHITATCLCSTISSIEAVRCISPRRFRRSMLSSRPSLNTGKRENRPGGNVSPDAGKPFTRDLKISD